MKPLNLIRVGLFCLALIALSKATWVDAKALLAQYLLQQAWSQTREDQQAHKPWPWFDSQPVAQMDWLNGQQHVLLNGLSGQVMAFAPGLMLLDSQGDQLSVEHWQQADTLMVGGHNDTHFSDLASASVGDQITLRFADDQQQRYQVTGTQIMDSRLEQVLPAQVRGAQTGQLLLVTCYPFNSLTAGGPLRYVVKADPVRMGNSTGLSNS